ncbi:hypothetical protein [Streptomyces sp. P17]|uniref:hypothetical protein n=1 Tax=Streptomyces sp. P17 TaxID=3074716 RepID=UPI0028F41963|nr:hypothetical protein [Streptomyces sp. P17]MDT9700310.1 hypothetical protein [Streptomyces sp. P17]
MSTRTWLRAVVLLLALCLPAAPADIPVAPAVQAGGIVEHDVVDTALRHVSPRRAQRPRPPATAVPPHPASRPDRAVAPPRPWDPPARRSVVLRC